ncbi:MAG TPA: phytoene desaturase family protein [Bacteroidales bacterium]|nr:phytoene desaturase family protein [Bacteroidales bacterium]
MVNKEVHIVGAGFAGLSAAAILAQKGYAVKVFEKNDTAGGRAGVLEINGYRFDLGPTWYWMPDVFESFFNRFGKSVADYYELKRIDPGYRVYFGKDDYIDVPAGQDELYELFESIETGSSYELDRFLKNAALKYELGMNKFVYMSGDTVWPYLRWDVLRNLGRMNFLTSVSAYVRKRFRNPRLRKILEFPVIFLGATASKTPALYTLMNYADLKLGTWYPVGGMNAVAQAFRTIGEEMGAAYFFNAPVQEILIGTNKTRGLRVEAEEYYSDAVVGAADYHHVEQHLLPEHYRRYTEKYWDSRVMAPSSLLFYIGTDKKIKNLSHHNLFFDEDFDKHASQIYDEPGWPSKPALYVSSNAQTDPSVAPPGHDNLIVLIPVAPGLSDTEETRDHYYNLVMDRLEKLTSQEIRSHVRFKKSFAHNDFTREYNSYKGNAYGLANTLLQTAFLKPGMRNPKLPNLFYTGQLTIPGPGVPPTIISGQVVAGEVDKYLNR